MYSVVAIETSSFLDCTDKGGDEEGSRAAADETESGSSVCGVVCVVTRGPPDCRRLS